ncbi:MAG: phosphoglucomutase/phosphomannomutase family protein [Ignavibacteria bacterium]
MREKEVVKFGTDGWRAIIADTYTFENVRRVSLATSRAFKKHHKLLNGIIIGYDTRFLSKEFAHCAAEVFANEGITTYLTDSFVTTPSISLITKDMNFAYGVMITASHNPYKYNGFKLKDEFGGSMSPENISLVENELKNIDSVKIDKPFEELLQSGMIKYFDGRTFYVDDLRKKIDVRLIEKANLRAVYDAMYGAGQNIINQLVSIDQLHAEWNPAFGGGSPEPVARNLKEIMDVVTKGNYDIGLVTDGDADRIAIIDEKGNFVDAQKTFALLLKYVHHYKQYTGMVVRGYSTSTLIEKYCEKYNLQLKTVPIGFKHISKIMISDDVMIGAEESGGIGIKGHLPERDGIFNALLYLEMLATSGKSVSELLKNLEEEFGKFFYNRIDVHTTDALKQETLEHCKRLKVGDKLANREIISIGNLDGYKFSFSDGWIIVRASGTEPLLRFYCETYGLDNTMEILNSTISTFKLH